MAEGTPVTYEDLTEELKKKYDEVKAVLEADLIGSFQRTRSHGIRWKGFSPEGALDGVDLSTLQKNAPGTHQGEIPLQSRPPLPFALAAPEVPSSPAFVVYKIGGDPSDYQFLDFGTAGGASGSDLEKQTWLAKYATPTNLQSSTPAASSELEKQAWLAKYATPANLQLDSCSQHRGSDQYNLERPVRHGAEKEGNRLFQAVPQRVRFDPTTTQISAP
ncbi:hypothetical protein QYE76_035454 [Lolium multiflorum]|uniref:Uncharacterized protein n=1 Tax=Lolium multiflorum TaxID=4521 RepID=A0AAD8VNH1_LOLMU|nr:hypothetical protein QYE76_035454 [Lolium multiflorum]